MIAGPGRKIEHRYRLNNATPHDIKILNVVNRKACCGDVSTGASVLHPGGACDIAVRLRVGDRFGQVVHETEVVTDSPDESSLLLRTAATAVPPLRVEQDTPLDRTIIMGAKESRLAAFRVYASGTSAELPVDLDRAELRSPMKVGWAGPKQSSAADERFEVEMPRFIATLDPTGPAGERAAEVVLRQGDQIHARYVVTWQIVPPIVASPKVVAIRSGQREYQVVIQSRDHRAFRIKRIECSAAGVEGRALGSNAALAQTIVFEGRSRPKDQRGAIAVFTDHPLQEKVDLPYVVIE